MLFRWFLGMESRKSSAGRRPFAGFRRTRLKGGRRSQLAAYFVGAAYNLVRMSRLLTATGCLHGGESSHLSPSPNRTGDVQLRALSNRRFQQTARRCLTLPAFPRAARTGEGRRSAAVAQPGRADGESPTVSFGAYARSALFGARPSFVTVAMTFARRSRSSPTLSHDTHFPCESFGVRQGPVGIQ